MASQPNWKLPLALSAVLFVVGSGVYWYEFTRKPKEEEKDENAKKIFSIKDLAVSNLKIIDGKQSLEFKCLDLDKKLCRVGDNSRWDMIAPLSLKADDSSVNGFLSSLNNVQPAETIDLSQDAADKKASLLSQYKLDEAARSSARRIELTIEGKVRTAFFGETHPIHEGLFVAISDVTDKVFVAPSYFTSNLEKDLSYWRDKKILSVNASQVTGFRLDAPKGKTRATRKDGEWTLDGGLPGDIENIDALVTSLTYLTAKAFPERSQTSGLRTDLKVELELADRQPPVVVTLHRKGYKSQTELGTLYVTVSGSPQAYEIDASMFNRLDKSPADFRLAKLITSLDRYGTKRIEASGGALGPDPLVLDQKQGKWLDSQGKEANNERVNAFLDKLSGNRIQEFLAGSKIPKGEDQGLAIRLQTEGGERKREIVFWRAGGKLYARDRLSKRSTEAFRVDTSIADNLPWDRGWFFSAPSPTPQAPSRPAHSEDDGHGH